MTATESGTRESLVRLEERLRTFAEELRDFVNDARKREKEEHKEAVARAEKETELMCKVDSLANDVHTIRRRMDKLEDNTGPITLDPESNKTTALEVANAESKARTKLWAALAAAALAIAGAAGGVVTKLLGP